MEEDLKGLDSKNSKSIAKKSIVVDFFRPLQIASACRENNIKFEKERLSSGNNLKLSRCFQTGSLCESLDEPHFCAEN